MSSPENTTIGGGGGAGVASFNTRTGAVSLTEADVLKTFATKGGILLGTGAGAGSELPIGPTGDVLTVVGGTAAWAPAAGGSFNIASPVGTQVKKYTFDASTEGWAPVTLGVGTCVWDGASSLVFTGPIVGRGLAADPLGPVFDNGEIWLDYREVVPDSGAGFGVAGISFRVQDASNYYQVQFLNTAPNTIEVDLYKNVAGVFTLLASQTITLQHVTLSNLFSNIILIRYVGTVIEVFLNNGLVLYVIDGVFTTSVLPILLATQNSSDIHIDTLRLYTTTISPNRIPTA